MHIKAVEQLGSAKAAVRLGGLYALERLAQDNPDHRQTIVNVICAYLRMPYTPPPPPPDPDQARAQALRQARRRYHATPATRPAPAQSDTTPAIDAEGERQVRLTAQTILTDHLRDNRDPDQRTTTPPPLRFWQDMRIYLTGATLININFTHCHTKYADFNGATFSGPAGFHWATFSGDAGFHGATFSGPAGFHGAAFSGDAWFYEATFSGPARFREATFSGDAGFYEATFSGSAGFNGATFSGLARFKGATFDTRHLDLTDALVRDPAAPGHFWPQGWRVIVQPDGTGRLAREFLTHPPNGDPRPCTGVAGS